MFLGNLSWNGLGGGVSSRLQGKRGIQRITLRKHRCCKLSFMGVLDTLSGLREKWSEQQLNLSSAERGGKPRFTSWGAQSEDLPFCWSSQARLQHKSKPSDAFGGHGGSQTTSDQSWRWRNSLEHYIYSSQFVRKYKAQNLGSNKCLWQKSSIFSLFLDSRLPQNYQAPANICLLVTTISSSASWLPPLTIPGRRALPHEKEPLYKLFSIIDKLAVKFL